MNESHTHTHTHTHCSVSTTRHSSLKCYHVRVDCSKGITENFKFANYIKTCVQLKIIVADVHMRFIVGGKGRTIFSSVFYSRLNWTQ